MKSTALLAVALSLSGVSLFAQTSALTQAHRLRDSRIAAPVNWSRLKAQGAARRYATTSAASVITRDTVGRVTQVLEPDAQGKPTLPTDITYDAQGKVVKIVQHGAHNDTPRIRTFTYDAQSRIISATSPEAGTITYTYDANGNIATKTDARNLTITYTWDAKRRLVSKTYSDGSPAAHIVYDDTTVTAYRGTLDAPLDRRVYHYDGHGHLIGLTVDAPANQDTPTAAISLQYDASDRLTGITYPDGTILTQAWGTNGQLDSISSSTTRYISTPAYSAAGYLTGYTLGDAIAVQRSFDTAQHLVELSASSHGKQQLAKVYAYTPSGDISSFSDDLDPTSSFRYTYDALDRVTKAEQAEGNIQNSFDYDPFGNRASSALPEDKRHFDAENRFTPSSGLTYNTVGEMTFDGRHSYTYNADGYIASVDDGAITYRYDAEGNRILKRIKTGSGTADTRYIWFDGQLLAQQQPDGIWIDYVYAQGNRIASTSTHSDPTTGNPVTDATTYFLTDTVGLTRMALSADGTVLSQGDFAPFGTLLRDRTSRKAPGIASAAAISFTGEVHDDETGLDTYKYRSYNPSLGRWMSPDPSGEYYANLSSPQSLNLYAYVLNDPLKYLDALGLYSDPNCGPNDGNCVNVDGGGDDDGGDGGAGGVGGGGSGVTGGGGGGGSGSPSSPAPNPNLKPCPTAVIRPANVAPTPTSASEITAPPAVSGTLTINTSGVSSSSGSTSSNAAGDGHAWITFTTDSGVTYTYGTWGNTHGAQGVGGVNENSELAYVPTASESTHITAAQAGTLAKYISAEIAQGDAAWTLTFPCSGFAAAAWSQTTGQNLDPATGGTLDDPTNLQNAINKANGGTGCS
ncbi:RHS repeat-associated core domain-containing protein [Granulicella sp. S156]|uniref:RHS repeat-associated core domain-containing protein n=1 Tax=Granulicella sp. S156 TaxID=1747224 RepID=UPI00131D53B8|nr:RHS repeat-associated core domain-containing protein [Granulicella sp. S156]